MEFTNYTPFPALAFVAIDQNDEEHHVFVVRATLEIGADGGVLAFADAQLPLVLTDQYYGEMNKSSVRQESDLAPYKPKCDINVIATAYAPGGRSTRRFTAGIRIRGPGQPRSIPPRPYGLNPGMAPKSEAIAAWEKEKADIKANPSLPGHIILKKYLSINGIRYWRRGVLGRWTLTTPEPILSLPLRYEYAYGGENRVERNDRDARKVPEKFRLTPEQRAQHPDGSDIAPIAHAACFSNPLGCSYAETWFLKALSYNKIRAPLIESPDDPIRNFRMPYRPQGLGVVGRAWQPRIKLAGTYDDAWLRQRHPYLPKDFDFAYWNGAHPDMQVPYLVGDEVVELLNLSPFEGLAGGLDEFGNTLLRFQLPAQRIRLMVESENGTFGCADMKVDTLIIEPVERRVSMVWRLLIPVSARIVYADAEVMPLSEGTD